MNFNAFIKDLISPYLITTGFQLKSEIEGLLEYESGILKIRFSYDFRVSYEVDVAFKFKADENFYTYSEIKELLFNEKNRFIATQIVKDEVLKLWVEEVYEFLKENLLNIQNKHDEICLEFANLRLRNTNEYATKITNKFFNETVEALWRAKNYIKLIDFLKKNEDKIIGSIEKKYHYALKMINT